MSLYTHIASKDDLLALMFNEMSGQLLVPEPLPGDWREALKMIARAAHDAYVAHPWMLHAFGRRPRVGPNQLRRGEQSAAAVAGLGVAPGAAWTAVSIVHEWTMGHALHVVTLREDTDLGKELRGADPAEFPRMAGALAASRSPVAAFDIALEAVLDGVETRLLA